MPKPKVTKDARLEVRLPETMKANLAADAEKMGMNPSEFVRWLYLRFVDKR